MNVVRPGDSALPMLSLPNSVGFPQGQRLDLEASRSVLTILFKWKWLIVACSLAISLPVAIVVFSRPTEYLSMAKVILKRDRADTAITAGERERFVTEDRVATQQMINTEMQIIRSRDVLQEAMQAVPVPSMEVIEGLQVTPIRDSSIIQVAVKHTNQEIAVTAVNRIIEVYQKHHAVIHHPAGAFEFFDKQVALYRQQLQEAEEQLNAFNARTGGAVLERLIVEAQTRIENLQERLRGVTVDQDGLRPRTAFLKREVDKQPAMVMMVQDTAVNPTGEELERQLIRLQIERQSLLQLYTEKDRRVVAKDEEIKAVQAHLAAQSGPSVRRESSGLNPVRRTLEGQLLEAESRMKELVAQRTTLEDQLASARQLLERLNEQNLEYLRLIQAEKVNRRNYDLYEKKREEARISEAMDREKLLNVGVLEHASLPARAVPTRRGLSLLVATLSGLVLGVGLAFGIEFFNATFKHEREVERYLELPVLASIDRFRF